MIRKKCLIFIFILITLVFLFLLGCASDEDTYQSTTDDNAENRPVSIPTLTNQTVLTNQNDVLETTPITESGLTSIVNMTSQNTLTGTGGNYSLQDADNIAQIKQLRYLPDLGMLYNVYEIGKGRFYVFYHSYSHRVPYGISFYCYAEKKLLFSDFNDIKKRTSTIADVRDIDEATDYFDNGFFSPTKEVLGETLVYEDSSLHMTKEGVVAIGYTKRKDILYVDYIKKHDDERIANINPLDLP